MCCLVFLVSLCVCALLQGIELVERSVQELVNDCEHLTSRLAAARTCTAELLEHTGALQEKRFVWWW